MDKSGELLLLEGLDLTNLDEGKGTVSTEHLKPDTIGEKGGVAGFMAFVGSIKFAKKIFSKDDCETDDELKFWNTVKLPYLYVICELFDDQTEHSNAKALAAMINHYHERGEPLAVGFSIEGDIIEKTPNGLIKNAIARGVAATVRPCNSSCIAEVFEDDKKKAKLDKNFMCFTAHTLEPFEKTLTAGGMDAAPSTLTQGSALQKEHIKDKVRKTLMKWDGESSFEDFIKTEMPEASPEFILKFKELADNYKISKKKLLKKSVDSISGFIDSNNLHKQELLESAIILYAFKKLPL